MLLRSFVMFATASAKRLTALNNASLTHQLTNGVHDSKEACVLRVDIFKTQYKLICKDKRTRN